MHQWEHTDIPLTRAKLYRQYRYQYVGKFIKTFHEIYVLYCS